MKADILKIAGVNNEQDFYKKFPTQKAFMAKHGAAFKKLQKAQGGFGTNQPGMINPEYDPYGGKLQGLLPSSINKGNLANPSLGPVNTGIGDTNKNSIPDYLEGADAPVNTTFGPKNNPNPTTSKSMPDFSGPIGAATDIIGGIKALGEERKQARSAKAWRDVSAVSLKAFNTPDVNERTTIADTAKRERKALMPSVNAESLFPTYGVGTNVLAKAGGKLPTGGLSRGDDYGSKSKPYPSVSSSDFAGGGRSYPIPTKQDAGDALRLAGLHHRPDVKAKVYAKYPELRRGQDGEIMNTYVPPTDIYSDLGYEPLEDSEPGFQFIPPTDEEIVKAYRGGGLFPIAASGMDFSSYTSGAGGGAAGSMSSIASSLMGGENAGSQIGGGIGYGAGALFGSPEIGQAIGSALGTAIDPYGRRIKKDQEAMMRNVGKMSGISNTRNFLGGFHGVVEDGGYMSHNWNPQVITKFGDVDVSDIHDHFYSDMKTLRTGGNIRTNEVGDIEAVSGGHLEPMSFNPFADGSGYTSMIKGQSHDESNGDHTGVLMNYKRQDGGDMEEPQVEAERGEPIKEIGDNAVIFGDIKISKHTTGNDPDFAKYYGKTFKKAMEDIANNDKKLNAKQAKNSKELASFKPVTPFDKLKFNSLSLNEKGINQKYAMNNALTQKASQYQELVNNEAEARGLDAGALSRGQFKPNINSTLSRHGSNIPKAQNSKVIKATTPGRWDFTQAGNTGNPEFDDLTAYDTVWAPSVREALADKERADKMINYMENITGPGSAEIKAALAKQPTKEAKIKYMETQATNKQVGPMHHVMKAAIMATKPGTAVEIPPTGDTPKEQAKTYGVTPYKKTGLETIAGQLMPWFRKQPGENLLGDQLSGEMFALGQNRIEPVQARMYHPELDVPYDISLQDQMNANQADFNQMQRAVGNNPAALSALAAQKYGANSNVLGEQFRMNQAMKDRVYSGNRATLNQAQQTNLGLMDQQYTRQEQAKSNTKETAQEALNSIASKIGQNRLENRTLQTYSNMFPDFSFDKSYRARHTGAPVDWNIDQGIYDPHTGKPTHLPVEDANGKVIGYQPVDGGAMIPIKDDGTANVPSAATVPISGVDRKGNTTKTMATATNTGPEIIEEKKKKNYGGLVKAFKNI